MSDLTLDQTGYFYVVEQARISWFFSIAVKWMLIASAF